MRTAITSNAEDDEDDEDDDAKDDEGDEGNATGSPSLDTRNTTDGSCRERMSFSCIRISSGNRW